MIYCVKLIALQRLRLLKIGWFAKMNIEMVRLFDIYSPLLNDRQREVLSLYYNEDESLGEISENIGITRQGVRDCIVKAEALLKGYESALRLSQKYKDITKELKDIVKTASEGDSLEKIINRINAVIDSMDV